MQENFQLEEIKVLIRPNIVLKYAGLIYQLELAPSLRDFPITGSSIYAKAEKFE